LSYLKDYFNGVSCLVILKFATVYTVFNSRLYDRVVQSKSTLHNEFKGQI